MVFYSALLVICLFGSLLDDGDALAVSPQSPGAQFPGDAPPGIYWNRGQYKTRTFHIGDEKCAAQSSSTCLSSSLVPRP